MSPTAHQQSAEVGATGGRIRFLEPAIVDHQDLLLQLRRLAGGVDADQPDLSRSLAGVTDALQHAVSGYAGLRLTVVHTGLPVNLAVPIPVRGEPCTSLGMPLTPLMDACAVAGRVVFYSAVPGAFVDLAADLTHLLDPTGTRPDLVELDVDQPLSPGTAILTGLEDLAALNRAIGYLIGQGNDPDAAHETLRLRAAAAGMTMTAFAKQLIGP